MNYLKNFDFFGTDISFTYKGSNKYKSNFGFLNTICFGVFCILTTLYFSQEIFEKKQPTVILNKKTVEKPEFYNLEKNSVFLSFGVFSEHTKSTLINESIFTIAANIVINNRSLPIDKQLSLKEINLEPCNESHLKYAKSADLKAENIENHYCISDESYKDLKIQGIWADNYYQGIQIIFLRCFNNSKCASENEIDKFLENLWISIYEVDSNLESTNFKNPTVFKKKYFTKPFTKQERMYVIATFSQNKIVSDKGFLFEDLTEKKFIQIDKVEISPNYRVTNEFVRLTFECSNQYQLIQRNYLKIPTVLAEIGGILSLIQFLYKLIINPIVNVLFVQDIINTKFYKVIDSKEKKRKKLKIKKNYNQNIKSNKNYTNEINSIITNEEGKPNEIKIERIPNIMIKNSPNYLISKLKTKFWDLVKIIIFKKKLKNVKKQKNIENSIKEINNFFDIEYIFDKIMEINLIKQIVFDENQRNFIDLYPHYIVNKNKETSNNKFPNNLIELIKLKEKKDNYDNKILENYYFIKR